MTRQRTFFALATVLLLPHLAACSSDGTGPDVSGGLDAKSRITARFLTIDVKHDCDPALDNPGDFQSWIEIWQDMSPSPNVDDWQRIAVSAKRVMTVSSGQKRNYDGNPRLDVEIARVQGQPLNVKAFVRELDNGVVDAANDQVEAIEWRDSQQCWYGYSNCISGGTGGVWGQVWSRRVNPRNDVFDIINPDDEGCEFTVTYEAQITNL